MAVDPSTPPRAPGAKGRATTTALARPTDGGRPDLGRDERMELLQRAVDKGVNPVVYTAARLTLVPFFRVWFRLRGIGRGNVPRKGPVIIASNHRSFLDPFVVGAVAGRPLYFMAKMELFRKPLQGWFLNSLGAFPIDRGNADGDAMTTARALLARGECVMVFPEGTRTRPGGLGVPKRGVGRLALETGVPVVPVSVHGTTHIRRGWRIRPHKVTVRLGRPLTFPHVEEPTAELASSVTARIWPAVELGWNALGGHVTERGLGVDPSLLDPALEDRSSAPRIAGTSPGAVPPGPRALPDEPGPSPVPDAAEPDPRAPEARVVDRG